MDDTQLALNIGTGDGSPAAAPRLRGLSHIRKARSVQIAPDTDRWVMTIAALEGCSYSEAVNRLLEQQKEIRNQLGLVFETGRAPDGASPVVHVLLEAFKETIARSLDNLREEVRSGTSNLYLIQSMIDQLVRLGWPDQHESWVRKVKELQTRRGQNAPKPTTTVMANIVTKVEKGGAA